MAMIYFITISIDNPICGYITEKWGLRVAMLLGCGLMLVGGIIKSFMNSSYTYAIIGQTIIAIAFPLVYINSSKLSENWFPKKQRVMTTMIGMESSVLGVAVGFILPLVCVSKTTNVDLLRTQIVNMLNYVWIF